MSTHLGKVTFLDTPDVNGVDVLTGQVGSVLAGTFSSRPGAGVAGRLYVDTTNNSIWRDNGASWDLLSAPVATANQIAVNGQQVQLANNLIMPGTEGFVPPTGTTAQRPASPITGEHRYNTTNAEPEVFTNGAWLPYARVIQSVSGSIAATTGTGNKTTTTVPLVTEGIQIWSTSFTPLVAGSNLVVQYTVSMAHATSGRSFFTAPFAGSTCIGLTSTYSATAGALYNLTMQAVYPTTSTAALTISARAGTLNGTGAVYVNQTTASVTYGSATVTEFRILEMI